MIVHGLYGFLDGKFGLYLGPRRLAQPLAQGGIGERGGQLLSQVVPIGGAEQ